MGGFVTGPILIWEGKVVFTGTQDEYDLMVTNIEDKNSLNNEKRNFINAVPNAKKFL